MKKILLLAVLICTCHEVQAQNVGKAILQGVLNGVREGVRQSIQTPQRSNANSFSLENTHATPVQGASSFSLANTHATVVNPIKEVQFNDGRSFRGFVSDDQADGTLTYANGESCKGVFDALWRMNGRCFVRYLGDNWYYGNYEHGVENGEGSIYVDGEYYDLVFNMGEITKSVRVSKPKYDYYEEQAKYQAALANFQQQMLEQQQSYEVSTNSGYGSNTSRSSRTNTSTSRISRQADATAKAYEMYKSNPNATSHQYYISNKKLLNSMQGR